MKKISISIIIHQQASLAVNLLNDFDRLKCTDIEVLLTVNIPEEVSISAKDVNYPLSIIRNKKAQGFGANHNAAFRKSQGRYFCITNPDIRLPGNPFPMLIQALDDPLVAGTAPIILNGSEHPEDNLRHFPTPASILAKSVGIWPAIEYPHRSKPFCVDWAAGMFLFMQANLFAQVGGFNERFYLYYEDVDLCARLKIAGYKIMACPSVSVIHNARRESHRNPKFFRWHLQSMLRFFFSRTFRQVRALKSS